MLKAPLPSGQFLLFAAISAFLIFYYNGFKVFLDINYDFSSHEI